MSDGVIFLVLLLVGIALSGWLGFVFGEDYGWRACARTWMRLAEESAQRQAQREETS